MLPTRDPPQNKRHTQTESERLEKKYYKNGQGKKSWASNTYIGQNRLQNKGHKKRLRRTVHNSQGKNPSRRHKHYKHIGSQHRNTQKIRRILEDFKKDRDSNIHILGYFNTPLSKIDRSSKQNINKDIVALNNALDQMDLTVIYRNLSYQRSKIHILFKSTWNIFKDRSHDRKQNKPQQIQEN